MYLPARVIQIVQALYSRNTTLAQGTDDQRRQLVMLFAQQVRFELGPSWGTKRADPGRPLSKDAIAQKQPDGTLLAWDLIDGASRKPFPNPGSIDISKQVFVAVEPFDYLGVGVPIVPPPPPPPVESKGLQDQINSLQQALATVALEVSNLAFRLDVAVKALELLTARVNAPIRTTNSLYHSHEVKL